jgi:hypothetical protein
MKQVTWLVAVVVALALTAVGCGKKGSVDTSKLESSFAQAEPGLKGQLDKIVSSIKAQNYSEAAASLQKLAGEAKLTDTQKQAIQNVLNQLKQLVADAAGKMKEGANKTMEKAKEALPK